MRTKLEAIRETVEGPPPAPEPAPVPEVLERIRRSAGTMDVVDEVPPAGRAMATAATVSVELDPTERIRRAIEALGEHPDDSDITGAVVGVLEGVLDAVSEK